MVNSIVSVLQKTKQLAELWTRQEENGESFVWFENEAQYKSQEIGGGSGQWPHPSLSLILCFSPCWVFIFIHWIHRNRTPALCQGWDSEHTEVVKTLFLSLRVSCPASILVSLDSSCLLRGMRKVEQNRMTTESRI